MLAAHRLTGLTAGQLGRHLLGSAQILLRDDPRLAVNTGGLDQVSLETGADLLNLENLDQKLWVALSCPVKGLELDETTLKMIDTDGDGRITAPPWNQVTGRGDSLLYAGDTTGGSGLGARGGSGGSGGTGGGPDPKLDTLVSFSLYGVIPSPVDDSVWGVSERFPGYLVRVDRGKNPPQSCITEVYKVPAPGLDPRGLDVDRNGVVWTALAASSHLASFDRRKCKSLTGPRKTDGSDCPEGWQSVRPAPASATRRAAGQPSSRCARPVRRGCRNRARGRR